MSQSFLRSAEERSHDTMAEALDDTDDGHPKALVLVGVTGEGKSSTGNTLCGHCAFAVSDGLSSETAAVAHADYLRINDGEVAEMRVVDTIGLHDTGLPAAEVMRRFGLFADLVPTGIHCFLFCVRWGRYRPEHEAAVDAFAANCGADALRHTLLIFTSCPLSPVALAAALEAHAPASLRRLLARLPTPPIGIDNVAEPAVARASIHAAVDAVCSANYGKRYSNAELGAARRRHDVRAEAERAAFAAAVADWRKGTGPVLIERE